MASPLSQTVLFFIFLHLSLHQACAEKAHLHFYLHEILSGPNATKTTVVQAPNSTSFTFGSIDMFDDPLRFGQDENSTLIGRSQDIVAAVGRDGGIQTMLNFFFTEGKYNGSSLAIYGRIVLNSPTERTVIGGTGVFRLARGYCLGNLVSCSDLVGVAGMDGILATMLNFVFTAGKYNGSSLAIYGRAVANAPIERSVIGGSVVFRMARGYQIGTFVPSSSSATKKGK